MSGGAILVMLNRQRELLHERLEKVAKFQSNDHLSNTVIDIMMGLDYPDVPEDVCEWCCVKDCHFIESNPYFVYGNINGSRFHGVGMYHEGSWRSCEEDVPFSEYGISITHFMEMTCP